MSKITYLNETSLGDLAKEVNAKLKQGWTIAGPMTVDQGGDTASVFIQPMIIHDQDADALALLVEANSLYAENLITAQPTADMRVGKWINAVRETLR